MNDTDEHPEHEQQGTEAEHDRAGSRPFRFRIDLPADVSSIGTARHFVRGALRRLGGESTDAELAVSEMFTAAIAGAGVDDRIEVEVRRRGDEIDIDVSSMHGRHDLDPVQRSVMRAVADYYDRRDIGDTEVQSYGSVVVCAADATDATDSGAGLQRPASASTTGANPSGSRTT